MTRRGPGIGMPAHIHLDAFGRVVEDYFGEMAFLVGSAAVGKQWRDVDVRVMLDRPAFVRFFGEPIRPHYLMPSWAACCAAFAELGRRMTGLPIDFQVQLADEANARYDGPRHFLGLRLFPPVETDGGTP